MAVLLQLPDGGLHVVKPLFEFGNIAKAWSDMAWKVVRSETYLLPTVRLDGALPSP